MCIIHCTLCTHIHVHTYMYMYTTDTQGKHRSNNIHKIMHVGALLVFINSIHRV